MKTVSERWDLDDSTRRSTFLLTSYKPIFVTFGRCSSNPNKQPYSENPAYSVPTPTKYNSYEARFQFSFKTKVLQRIFWGKGDLWVAYTQKAHWQIYNAEISRPFRELNYEPEVIQNFPIRYKIFGFIGRTIGAGLIINQMARICHTPEAGAVLPFIPPSNERTFKLFCGHGFAYMMKRTKIRPLHDSSAMVKSP